MKPIDEKLKKKCIGLAGSDWRDTYTLIQKEREEERHETVWGFFSYLEKEGVLSDENWDGGDGNFDWNSLAYAYLHNKKLEEIGIPHLSQTKGGKGE
jgi:hypothetical protein